MIDTIIEGADIYDGRSAVPFRTDVALIGDRIALIGSLADRDAHERIAASGLALAPGFIDVHAHTDDLWLADGRCRSKIQQGVTTEIGGNCGSSVAPAPLGAPWRDLDDFFAAVVRSGVSLNIATLVGLGTTRARVARERDGRLDAFELRQECNLVRTAIEQGALGVSSGLIYVPSRYADRDELVACAATARAAGAARYVTHLRSEGDALFEATDEALEIARRADVAVQFSHHKAAGKKNWGKVERSLDMISRARLGGLAAAVDVYPYVATCTRLDTILPDDAQEGGKEATLARLADPATFAALTLRLSLDRSPAQWHDIAISTVASERNADIQGLRLDAIAERRHLSPARAALELLRDEGLAVDAIFFTLREDDVATVLSADFVAVGSDASARAHDGPTARGFPHPRTFGTFPRIFGRFVRGRRTLEIGEAIRRMTSLAADTFGIVERGSIVKGGYADLVLFDPATIADTATYECPYSYPTGIDYVWVNGLAVVRHGEATGERPGRVLRGGHSS
ncbi:MAG: amidohydrolase family protein [Candidatus Eremiobacteraeota bacterium]|nr:amidohydrolase family protein [Candidatus Eremiobacteraeota bacterium]MBC5801486.1 amidohydrolase family protein [Candidatus Eremiobacteraeota bacterium]MBC5822221.1 amidohydrolase family protein [Candidatus Eremiobacteraeota bacterium]